MRKESSPPSPHIPRKKVKEKITYHYLRGILPLHDGHSSYQIQTGQHFVRRCGRIPYFKEGGLVVGLVVVVVEVAIAVTFTTFDTFANVANVANVANFATAEGREDMQEARTA